MHGKHPTWEQVRLADIASLTNGYPYKSKAFNDSNGTPIVRIRDVLPGKTATYYDGPIDDPRMTILQSGQIAVGMDGDFNCRTWKGGKVLLNQRVCTLDASDQFYSQRLLAFALPGYLNLINQHTSSITVKHLSSKTILDIPLPLPPLPEQERIVEKIETLFAELDKGEEALREVQKLLARYRQSVLKAAVTGTLTSDWRKSNGKPTETGHDLLARILIQRRETWKGRGNYKEPVEPDIEVLPEMPKGWGIATTDQLAFVDTGATPKKGKSEYYAGGSIPWVTSTAVNDVLIETPQDYITSLAVTETNAKVFPAGTLIVALYGEGKTRGKVSKLGIDAATNQACAGLRVGFLPPTMADYLRLFYVYNYETIRLLSAGGVQPNLNLSIIRGTLIPLPPLNEVEQIVEAVDVAMKQVSHVVTWCETELNRAASLRQSILKDAFSGKLVPQNPSDEPAEKLLERIRAGRAGEPKAKRKIKTKA